jgi:BlaI family penicillinase repressor
VRVKKLHQLTELQLTIMDVLWRRKEATVVEVHEAIAERTRLARKTVGTLLARLEQQGLLTHREEGREYVYRPTVSRSEVGRATVRTIFATLFPDDLPALVSHALEAEQVRPGDVERVRELLDEWERKRRGES